MRFLTLILALSFAASAAPLAQPVMPPKDKPRASLVVESEEAAEPAPPGPPQGDERRAIGELIRENSGPIRECYEKRLQERPTLSGKLVARFDIGPHGKVIGAAAEGMADRELIVCVLTAVRKLEFEKPRSGGKLRVAYPFKFEPRPAK
jgi:outer membrane biosynthesis protein TonB